MLAEISTAIASVKSLMDIAAASNDHKFIVSLNALYESLMVAREKILELQEDNLLLKKENMELKDKRRIVEDLEFRGYGLFKKSSNEGPFCNACWSDKEKSVRLHRRGTTYYYDCPVCQGCFCSDHDGARSVVLKTINDFADGGKFETI